MCNSHTSGDDTTTMQSEDGENKRDPIQIQKDLISEENKVSSGCSHADTVYLADEAQGNTMGVPVLDVLELASVEQASLSASVVANDKDPSSHLLVKIEVTAKMEPIIEEKDSLSPEPNQVANGLKRKLESESDGGKDHAPNTATKKLKSEEFVNMSMERMNPGNPSRNDVVASLDDSETRIRELWNSLQESDQPPLPTPSENGNQDQMANSQKSLNQFPLLYSDGKLDTVIRRITEENRDRAKVTNAKLAPLCSDPVLGLDGMPSIPRVWETDDEKLAHALLFYGDTDFEFIVRKYIYKQLAAVQRRDDTYDSNLVHWMARNEKWRNNTRNASVREKQKARDRDRFILMSTRGPDAITSSRTSSGRVSYRSGGGVGNTGVQPSTTQTLQEVDMLLDQIEHYGGTPSGSERYKLTVVTAIPKQDPNYCPVSGSSLLENPVVEHHSVRAVNPWTVQEKITFMEKWLIHQKDFRTIAKFLPNKSVPEVHKFYFQNKLRLNLKGLLKEATTRKKPVNLSRKIVTLANRGYSMDAAQKYYLTPALLMLPPNGDLDGFIRGSASDANLANKGERAAWTLDEKKAFIRALAIHGLNYVDLAGNVKSKTAAECKEFYETNRLTMGLDGYSKKTSNRDPSASPKSEGLKIARSDSKKYSSSDLNRFDSRGGLVGRPAKRGRWSSEEEALFKRLMDQHGHDWEAVAAGMNGKTPVQVKAHWESAQKRMLQKQAAKLFQEAHNAGPGTSNTSAKKADKANGEVADKNNNNSGNNNNGGEGSPKIVVA